MVGLCEGSPCIRAGDRDTCICSTSYRHVTEVNRLSRAGSRQPFDVKHQRGWDWPAVMLGGHFHCELAGLLGHVPVYLVTPHRRLISSGQEKQPRTSQGNLVQLHHPGNPRRQKQLRTFPMWW